MKTLLVSHGDLDGISPAIIAQYYKIPIDTYWFKDYDFLEDPNFNQSMLVYDRIYITDLSIQDETYKILEENNKEFYVFDHHEQTRNFETKKNVFFNLEKSGTEIFFEELTGKKRISSIAREFVTLVGIYDLWKLEHPLREKAEKLNKLTYELLNYRVNGYGRYQNFIERQLIKLQTNKTFEFTPFELSKIHNAEIKEKNAVISADKILQLRKDSHGKGFGITKSNRKISYLCSKLLEKYEGMDYIVCINTYNISEGKISVRSLEPFSVLDLQDVDGHKCAGGGFRDVNFISKLWSGEINELGYENE